MRSRRNVQLEASPSSEGTVEHRTERRLRKADRHVDERLETVALEDRVRNDAEIDVEIARRTAANAGFAVAADADTRTIVDAGRNLYGELALDSRVARVRWQASHGDANDVSLPAALRADRLRYDLAERRLPHGAHDAAAARNDRSRR